MKDDGLLTRVSEQRAAFESDLLDCKDTFETIQNICNMMMAKNREPQLASLIHSVAERGIDAATASMEV